jgi:hypothetical protein
LHPVRVTGIVVVILINGTRRVSFFQQLIGRLLRGRRSALFFAAAAFDSQLIGLLLEHPGTLFGGLNLFRRGCGRHFQLTGITVRRRLVGVDRLTAFIHPLVNLSCLQGWQGKQQQ